MIRKRVTWSMWFGLSLAHATVVYLVFSVVLPLVGPLRVLPPPPPSTLYKLTIGVGGILLLGAPAFGYFWSKLYAQWYDRRHPCELLCTHCSYNLTGNVSGVCPECGTPIQSSERGKP